MLWKLLFTYPLMVGIQIVSARVGRVTGHGLATYIHHYPPSLLYFIVGLGIAKEDVGGLLGD